MNDVKQLSHMNFLFPTHSILLNIPLKWSKYSAGIHMKLEEVNKHVRELELIYVAKCWAVGGMLLTIQNENFPKCSIGHMKC